MTRLYWITLQRI
ncbi:inner membrane transport permease yadH, partial [Yersinia pestis PY-56]